MIDQLKELVLIKGLGGTTDVGDLQKVRIQGVILLHELHPADCSMDAPAKSS
jgi:hypothetical protein